MISPNYFQVVLVAPQLEMMAEDLFRPSEALLSLLADGGFDELYSNLSADKSTLAAAFHIENTIDFEAIGKQYREFAERIRPGQHCISRCD